MSNDKLADEIDSTGILYLYYEDGQEVELSVEDQRKIIAALRREEGRVSVPKERLLLLADWLIGRNESKADYWAIELRKLLDAVEKENEHE